MTEVLKVELDTETCCICGGNGDLLTPEEFDSSAPPMQVPLRSMLLHLNSSKVVPEGRLCMVCARRAVESYDFSITISAGEAPPLSEKIRALRRKLHELTQNIDVYIVVGGGGVNSGTATYNEEDIIMVEKEALAAAAAADDEDMERARNARGDTVYQCSVCPLSFQRLSEYRAHASAHPADALHSCWTCGAQFATRDALRDHADSHAKLQMLVCHLCAGKFQSPAEIRRHEAGCPSRCPACAELCADRGALSRHAAARHGRGARPPLLCPACFAPAASPDLLSAHLLTHRQVKQFVCGYDGCILRFGTRNNLMSHIRKCHGGTEEQHEEPQPLDHSCAQCGRTFASAPALKRHARVHKNTETSKPVQIVQKEDTSELFLDNLEEEVEYLEVETLDEAEYQLEKLEDMEYDDE